MAVAASAASSSSRKDFGVLPEFTAAVATASSASSLFANELSSSVDQVVDHVSKQLVGLTEVAAYWKQRAAIESEYAAALSKLAKTTRDKASFINFDGWVRLVPLADIEASQHTELASMIDTRLSEPLKEFAEVYDANHKMLVKVVRGLQKDLTADADSVRKRAAEYEAVAQDHEIAVAALAAQKKAKSSKIAKHEKDVAKARKALDEASARYSGAVDTGNKTQLKLYGALTTYETMETRRIERTMQLLELMVQSEQSLHTRVAAAFDTTLQAVAAMSPEASVAQIARELAADAKPKPPAYVVVEHVPGTLTPKNAEKMRKIAAGDVGRVGVFGVELDELLDAEAENAGAAGAAASAAAAGAGDSSVGVPRVVRMLASAVLDRGAKSTEGVFRVPGDVGDINRCKAELNGGAAVVAPADVHSAAGLFKVFFRDLPTPLIPPELYAEALAASDAPERIPALLEKLPPVNLAVANFLLAFLADMCSDPAVVAVTKMTDSNLGMVFSPSFLRNPSEDPSAIMATQPQEQKFVTAMLKSKLGTASATASSDAVAAPAAAPDPSPPSS